MSSTLLEITRSTQEDIERFQNVILDELDYEPANFRESAYQNTKVNLYLEKIVTAAEKLDSIYADKDNVRKEEIQSISGQGPNVFSIFYDKLRELKEYHRKFPNTEIVRPDSSTFVEEDEIIPNFTGEEGYGKALDLHSLHDKFNNLTPDMKKLEYYTYVDSFFNFSFPLEFKIKTKNYMQYLESLLEYLESFIVRAHPLFDYAEIKKKFEEEFQTQLASGSYSSTFEELTHLRKKKKQSKNKKIISEEEMQNPLFCRACEKLFAKQTVFDAHMKGKKHIKNVQNQAKQEEALLPDNATLEKRRKKLTTILHLEFLITEICSKLLHEQVENSKVNVTKKLARTWREIEEDMRREEEGDVVEVVEEDETEEIKTSIPNYPIGWDGKPIPYWLYKLHGLGVEYKCEICGNASYFGRKAYEKHFQEWRHAHGMRCLGIPNTKHFHDITKINDAIGLWNKMKKDNVTSQWKPETEEEYEDAEGNVFNKKTYEDLRRQGIINT